MLYILKFFFNVFIEFTSGLFPGLFNANLYNRCPKRFLILIDAVRIFGKESVVYKKRNIICNIYFFM